MNTITMGPRDIYQNVLNVQERHPSNMYLLVDISDALFLSSDIDSVLTSLIVEAVSTVEAFSDIYEHAITRVASFFDSCGFRTAIDTDDYLLVDRILGIESLFSSVEDIAVLIRSRMSILCGNSLVDYCLVRWLNNTEVVLEGLYWISYEPQHNGY